MSFKKSLQDPLMRLGRICLLLVYFLTGCWLSTPAQAGSFFGTITATTTAQALGTAIATRITVQADPDNTVDLFVGDGTSQPIQLTAGQSVTVHGVTSLWQVYVKSASATAVANFIGAQ